MFLVTTTQSLELVLASASGTPLPFVADYADHTTTAFTPGMSNGTSNGIIPAIAVAAPAASTQRQIKALNVFNEDSSARTVSIQLNDNGTRRIRIRVELQPNESLHYEYGRGWRVLDASGSTKQSITDILGIQLDAGSGASSIIDNSAQINATMVAVLSELATIRRLLGKQSGDALASIR